MKRNKLLFSLLGIALAGVIVTGCGNGDNTTTSTNPGGSEGTTPSVQNPTTPPVPSTTAPITDDTWTVSFDYNYETKFKTYMTSSVKDGDLVEKPTNPIRQGYDFVAWYDDPYCRSQYLWDFETPVRQSMTLYANWELNGEEITENDYVIMYQTQLGASYVPVDGANLVYTAEYGQLVRFKIAVESEGYEGTPVVTANGEVITPDEEGIYSYNVTGDLTFEISGLIKISNAYKVYYENPNGWSDVYIYMWDSNSVAAEGEAASTSNAAWPGERMSFDGSTGMYYYEIESVDDCMYNSIVFNDGVGGTSKQTSDLTLMLGYSTNATLYSGDAINPVASEFDPKSTTAQITWTESDDYTFLTVDGEEGLATSAERGSTISFKVRIDKEDYSGEPKVLVNGNEVVAVDGVYSFEVTQLRYTVKVTNIMAAGVVQLYYTLPTWNPVAYNPKIYYWGTDENGAEMHNTLDWDNASDTQGSMTLVSGNEYVFEINLEDGQKIDGLIVVMYQDGAKKQSFDIINDGNGDGIADEPLITSNGAYELTFAEGWGQKESGDNKPWFFTATFAVKE